MQEAYKWKLEDVCSPSTWSIFLLVKLIVPQLVKVFNNLYEMQRFTNTFITVRFEVLTAASIKMAIFWVVAPCSLVEVQRRFRGACYSKSL
jgi:hypothetical protein